VLYYGLENFFELRFALRRNWRFHRLLHRASVANVSDGGLYPNAQRRMLTDGSSYPATFVCGKMQGQAAPKLDNPKKAQAIQKRGDPLRHALYRMRSAWKPSN
jgi:hypothetical protein